MKINFKKIGSAAASLVIFIILCGLIGASFGFIISDKLGTELSTLQLILRLIEVMFIFLTAAFLQVIIHETGHLAAGLIRGYRFLSFMILNVMITRKAGKFHFSRFGIPGAGGQCLMVPPEKGDTDGGIAFYNAGGIIINALLGVMFFVILLIWYDSMSFETVSATWAMAVIGFLFALQNGIPLTMGGIPNDGKNIKELKRDRFSTNVFLNSMRVVAAMQEGDDIDSVMPQYMCDDRQLDLHNPIHAMALNLDLSRAVVKMDFEKACDIIDRALEHGDEIVTIYRNEFRMEQIFMSVVRPEYGHDADKLLDKDILTYMNKMARMRPDVIRILYAVARLHERDEKKADELYRNFNNICRTFHILSDVRYQTRIIEMVRKMPIE